MRISVLIALSLLLPTPLYAQASSDPIEFNQEEYNRQVTKEMEEMSQALQAMSTFMVKSMNNMTQAINQSIPGLTKSMGELAKSMGPIIKAAQENQKLGNEMDKRPAPATEDKPAAITCDHCHGSGAEGEGGTETCPTCHGTGSITRTQQSIFGMVQSQSVCPQCNGEGKIIKNKCKACAGEGIVYGEEVVEVKIPAGVAEGMQLSVNGKGNAGKHNGVPGDLLVVIEEESHPDLIRDENDLIYNLLLSVPTAALGGTVEIPTIDSKVKVKIEPGTQPGKVLRLRGKGLPNVNSYGYSNGTGDLLVNVSVYIPETLNKDEKQALEKMQESDNFKPNTSIKEKIFKKFKNFFD